MTKEELRIRFYEIQKEYRPIMDILTEKQYDYPEYLGFDASPSKLIYKPKVLFLGYNPAGGKDWRRLDAQHNPHLFLWPHLNEEKIFFFKENSARKQNAKWFELDKPVNNKFPRQMIDLMYELATLVYPDRSNQKGTNKEPFWADDFENSMMFMNLYPVATKDGEDMISLFKRVIQQTDIPVSCKENEWHLRMYFIGITHQMVRLIAPKLIVCMGSQTFHDYTYSPRYSHSINEIFTDPRYNNLIGFSRKGAWDVNIPNIAKTIYERAYCEKE